MSVIGDLLDFGADILSHSSNTKAINKVQGYATEDRNTNNALAQSVYGDNVARLQPFATQGAGAVNMLARRLGVDNGAPSGGNSPYGAPSGPDWSGYLRQNPDVAAAFNSLDPATRAAIGVSTPEQFAQWHYQHNGQSEGRQLPTTGGQAEPEVAQSQPQAPETIGGMTVDGNGAVTDARPTFTRPADPVRPTDPQRPTYTRPDAGARPTLARPDPGQLDVSLGSYQQSPDFQFQMDRGIGALKSDKTFHGLLRSGSALKGALDFSQNLANGDYDKWRSYVTGQYNTNRTRSDANFAYDASRSDRDYESDRGYGADVFASDRDYGTGVFEGDRTRGDNIFAADRSRGDSIFQSDRGYGNDVYDAERGYATDRYDRRTDDVRSLVSPGLAAASGQVGAGNSYYNNVSGNNDAYYGTMSDAALGRAANNNALYRSGARAYGRVEGDILSAAPGGASSYRGLY
jgi:hypothetical protein